MIIVTYTCDGKTIKDRYAGLSYNFTRDNHGDLIITEPTLGVVAIYHEWDNVAFK